MNISDKDLMPKFGTAASFLNDPDMVVLHDPLPCPDHGDKIKKARSAFEKAVAKAIELEAATYFRATGLHVEGVDVVIPVPHYYMTGGKTAAGGQQLAKEACCASVTVHDDLGCNHA